MPKGEREIGRQRKFTATYREGGAARGQMGEGKWLTLTHHAADSVVDNNNNNNSTTSKGNEQLSLPFRRGIGDEMGQ